MHVQWILPCLLLSSFLTQAIPVQHIDDNNGNGELDDDACKDYKTCDSRGYRYWNWLQGNISMPNPVDRTDGKPIYDRFYISDTVYIDSADGVSIRQDLLNHGLPNLDDKAYIKWYTSSTHPDTGEETEKPAYVNIINTHDGVLIALDNFREDDEAKQLPWSEIMYQIWQQSKAEDDKRSSTSGTPPGGSLSTLQYSIQKTVVNAQTMAVMELAYTKMGYSFRDGDTTWQKWTEQDTPNWFFALLGTDNCKGTLFLLNQHLVEAGKKEITEIWTRWDVVYPDIWYVIQPEKATTDDHRWLICPNRMTIRPAEWIKYLTPPPDDMHIDR
ncbi:MAG: hypothetical protein LQ338_004304 [Usnochroma carphineum]|nr:MAG: hypothetical protein LQ338_004304 [Usnochroma carphineum]